MKRSIIKALLFIGSFSPFTIKAADYWQQVNANQAPTQLQLLHPEHFLVYTLEETTLRFQMSLLSGDPEAAMIIALPLPDGSFRDFKVWQTSVMPDELAVQFPEIKTFTAEALDDPRVTAKIDFTLYGFHAMIYDGSNTSFIDPFDNFHDGFYMVHYKKDETRAVNERMKCEVHAPDENGPAGPSMDILQKGLPTLAFKTVNGYQLRTYRLAVSANHQYCQAATGLSSPTIAQALAKMTTTMNRINGIYERELSITMKFVANETLLIWPTATGSPNGADPFSSINTNPGSCINQNQIECDARISSGNYDIGHVFTTGGGGLSLHGCVCVPGSKAKSVTGSPSPVGDGFDVDFVAHEIGHEFAGSHPFNDGTNGSCGGGNINSPTAYEPGSGSTIMAYAGICPPDDLQPHSDPYFHAVNLNEIQAYSTTGSGGSCPVSTATGNKLVGYSSFTASYSIPYLTPFELSGPALKDSVADSATLYCWEEWDLGDVGSTFSATNLFGPIFRSYNPTPSPVRVFPKMSMVLAGTLSNAGVEGAQGEKVPTAARTLRFKCTFRNIFHGKGCYTFPDDMVTLSAVNTGAGFAVTSQNTTGLNFSGHSAQTVTWNVVGTNVAPISAANVEIYMSVDGGNNWVYHVGSFPNTGTASITVPNPGVTTTNARFKVKGSGNVFFNVNSKNFTVTYNSSFPISASVGSEPSFAADVKVFPVPAGDVLHVTSTGPVAAKVYNSVGEEVWSGAVNGNTSLPVSLWAKGIYIMHLTDINNMRAIKRFVVQ